MSWARIPEAAAAIKEALDESQGRGATVPQLPGVSIIRKGHTVPIAPFAEDREDPWSRYQRRRGPSPMARTKWLIWRLPSR